MIGYYMTEIDIKHLRFLNNIFSDFSRIDNKLRINLF